MRLSVAGRFGIAITLAAFAQVGASLHGARAVEVPPGGAWEAFDEGDPAGVEYAASVNALIARRKPELEADQTVQDRFACARADLAVWFLVKPDGAVSDAWADSASQLSPEVRDAFAAPLKKWKLPPTPNGKHLRLRVSLGPIPTAPLPPRLSCDAQVLEKGAYHVTQLEPGLERGPWHAVCPTGDGGVEIRTVKLTLKKYHDEVVDDPDEHTGREVKVKGCDAPTFLFKNVWSTKDGPLSRAKTTVRQDDWNSTVDIVLGATTYHLRIESPKPAKADQEERAWKILLDVDGATEELDAGTSVLPPRLEVPWAGDLDGDGRLDLLLKNHDETVDLGLYTSGSALRGHKLRLVATRSQGGC